MEQVIVRFLARSGTYLGLPKKVIAAVIDELLEREWAGYYPLPHNLKPLNPDAVPLQQARA